jgi:transposase-like protein
VVLNERRRRAVKLREAGVSVRETARQCELSTNTVLSAHRAYRGGPGRDKGACFARTAPMSSAFSEIKAGRLLH